MRKVIVLALLMMFALTGCEKDNTRNVAVTLSNPLGQHLSARVWIENASELKNGVSPDNGGDGVHKDRAELSGTRWYTVPEEGSGRLEMTFSDEFKVRIINYSSPEEDRTMEGLIDGDYIVLTKIAGKDVVKTYTIKYLGERAMVLEDPDGKCVTYVFENKFK